MTKICPTCKRPLGEANRPKRICARCGQPIRAHHKWRFNQDSRVEHRNCLEPDNYLPPHDPNNIAVKPARDGKSLQQNLGPIWPDKGVF